MERYTTFDIERHIVKGYTLAKELGYFKKFNDLNCYACEHKNDKASFGEFGCSLTNNDVFCYGYNSLICARLDHIAYLGSCALEAFRRNKFGKYFECYSDFVDAAIQDVNVDPKIHFNYMYIVYYSKILEGTVVDYISRIFVNWCALTHFMNLSFDYDTDVYNNDYEYAGIATNLRQIVGCANSEAVDLEFGYGNPQDTTTFTSIPIYCGLVLDSIKGASLNTYTNIFVKYKEAQEDNEFIPF